MRTAVLCWCPHPSPPRDAGSPPPLLRPLRDASLRAASPAHPRLEIHLEASRNRAIQTADQGAAPHSTQDGPLLAQEAARARLAVPVPLTAAPSSASVRAPASFGTVRSCEEHLGTRSRHPRLRRPPLVEPRELVRPQQHEPRPRPLLARPRLERPSGRLSRVGGTGSSVEHPLAAVVWRPRCRTAAAAPSVGDRHVVRRRARAPSRAGQGQVVEAKGQQGEAGERVEHGRRGRPGDRCRRRQWLRRAVLPHRFARARGSGPSAPTTAGPELRPAPHLCPEARRGAAGRARAPAARVAAQLARLQQ